MDTPTRYGPQMYDWSELTQHLYSHIAVLSAEIAQIERVIPTLRDTESRFKAMDTWNVLQQEKARAMVVLAQMERSHLAEQGQSLLGHIEDAEASRILNDQRWNEFKEEGLPDLPPVLPGSPPAQENPQNISQQIDNLFTGIAEFDELDPVPTLGPMDTSCNSCSRSANLMSMGSKMQAASGMDPRTQSFFRAILVSIEKLGFDDDASLKSILTNTLRLVTGPEESDREFEGAEAAEWFLASVLAVPEQTVDFNIQVAMDSFGISRAAVGDVFALATAIAKRTPIAGNILTGSRMATSTSSADVKNVLRRDTYHAIVFALSDLATQTNGSLLSVLTAAYEVFTETGSPLALHEWGHAAKTLLQRVGILLGQSTLLGGRGMLESTGILSSASADVYDAVHTLTNTIVAEAPVGDESGDDSIELDDLGEGLENAVSEATSRFPSLKQWVKRLVGR